MYFHFFKMCQSSRVLVMCFDAMEKLFSIFFTGIKLKGPCMIETKVVRIGHHITSLAYGSPFNFNFVWWAEIFLVRLCLYFFPFLIQCPLWNTLSGNICSELQSNYAITKSFIIRLLKLNVEKIWFSFIESYQFHSNLLSGWLKKHGRTKSKPE